MHKPNVAFAAFLLLAPSAYSISAEKPGFQKAVATVSLDAAEKARRDLTLVAGVQGQRYTDQGGSTSAGRTGGFNVHGVRQLQNNFILDGLDNNSISENVQELTTPVIRPSVDTIEEFKIITNAYSAEYGRNPGAAINERIGDFSPAAGRRR